MSHRYGASCHAMSALALLSLCVSGCQPAVQDDTRYRGSFLYAAAVGEEFKELLLPSGEVTRRLVLPSSGAEQRLADSAGVSDCGPFYLTTMRQRGNREAIFRFDMDEPVFRLLRSGHRPVCGPNGSLFFFEGQTGKRGPALFVAPIGNPAQATLLIDGAYGLPQPLVFAGNHLATYDPSRQTEVVFELDGAEWKRVWTGGDCQPLFWRSKTSQLVCEDAEGAFRTQPLMGKVGEVVVDAEKRDIRGVLHYWPKEDAILSTTIRGGWDGREHQDLIAVDLESGRVTTLLQDVNIDVTTFTRIRD